MIDTKKRKFEGTPSRPSKKAKVREVHAQYGELLVAAEPTHDQDAQLHLTVIRQGKRKWQTPKQSNGGNGSGNNSIESGDSGIWATCDMHKEAKCTGDLIDLFNKQAEELYGIHEGESESGDIEAEIKREISKIRQPKDEKLFSPVRVDIKCGCKQSRWVKRLTPMTLIGKATAKGLDEVAKSVLAPHFHGSDPVGKKFAIRTNIRNHDTLTRDGIVKQVAEAIGPGHKVNLKDYDLLVLVEVFQNICGMSVVPADFDQLRRYNLAEIHDARRNMPNQHEKEQRLSRGSGGGEDAADEVGQETPSVLGSTEATTN